MLISVNIKCIRYCVCIFDYYDASRYEKDCAYSSVAHMNYVVIGLFVFNVPAFIGAMFLMLSHGLVSSGLFMLVAFYMKGIKLVYYCTLVDWHV